MGHVDGWPFPLWTQAGGLGMGWHFTKVGQPYGNHIPQTRNNVDWKIKNNDLEFNSKVLLKLAKEVKENAKSIVDWL